MSARCVKNQEHSCANNYKGHTVAPTKIVDRDLVYVSVNDKKCKFLLGSASDVSIIKYNKCFLIHIASEEVLKYYMLKLVHPSCDIA